MDPDIRDALADIKTSVRDGFAAINRRIDEMVQKSEFNATAQRLDAQHGTLRRDFESHESDTAVRVAEIREADAAVARQAARDAEQIRSELREEFHSIRTTTRWAIGASITTIGLLITGGWALVNFLTN